MSDVTCVEKRCLWLESQFHRDVLLLYCDSKNAVIKTLLSNLKNHSYYILVVVVDKTDKISMFTADGEPVYAAIESNPEFESEPTHSTPLIQNDNQVVIS